MTRSRTRLVFWLAAFFVVYMLVAWSVDDFTVCVGSQMVEIGQAPVVNPVECQ